MDESTKLDELQIKHTPIERNNNKNKHLMLQLEILFDLHLRDVSYYIHDDERIIHILITALLKPNIATHSISII